MHPYPHTYHVSANGQAVGDVVVTSPSLPELKTAPPPEFDGPGGVWSPETLLCGAVADCFILTLRGLSRAARFEWLDLECRVEGTLERQGGSTQFTRYVTVAKLTVAEGADVAKAHSLLERTERTCLVSNSLRGERTLQAEIITAAR
jgi:organic hydroperoxide reductase OsmC/OhrA